MSNIFTYRDLIAWKDSMNLVEECYRTTAYFPKVELYGLTSQVRKAAVSIPSNIAEGHCRRSTRAYLNHVSIALGSHGEFATCMDVAARARVHREIRNRADPAAQRLCREDALRVVLGLGTKAAL